MELARNDLKKFAILLGMDLSGSNLLEEHTFRKVTEN
jgi:hypothetical protein